MVAVASSWHQVPSRIIRVRSNEHAFALVCTHIVCNHRLQGTLMIYVVIGSFHITGSTKVSKSLASLQWEGCVPTYVQQMSFDIPLPRSSWEMWVWLFWS